MGFIACTKLQSLLCIGLVCVCACGRGGTVILTAVLLLQQSNLEAFKTALLAKVSDDQLVEVWLKLLNELIEDLER